MANTRSMVKNAKASYHFQKSLMRKGLKGLKMNVKHQKVRSNAKTIGQGVGLLAALDKVIRYGPTAWRAALRFGRGFSSSSTEGKKKKGVRKLLRYAGDGTYKGSFGRRRRNFGKTMLPYNRDGVVETSEISGTVSDPDAVYLINHVVPPYKVIKMLSRSIFRKLFEMANIRITGLDDVLSDPAGSGPSADSFLIEYGSATSGGTITTGTVSLANTDTLRTVADSSTFVNWLLNYSSGYDNSSAAGNTSNLFTPAYLKLYTTHAAGAELVQQALIHLSEVTVDMVAFSEMKCQNRMLGAIGDPAPAAESDNVGANPLQGIQYMFQGVPRPKQLLEGVATTKGLRFSQLSVDDGIKFISGAACVNDFKEPISPQFFWNCKSASKIRLNPGEIKSFYARASRKMGFLKLLKALRVQYGVSTAVAYNNFETNYSIFPCQMISLEDLINVNANHNISVSYELERTIGVKVEVRKKKFCRTYYEQTVYAAV